MVPSVALFRKGGFPRLRSVVYARGLRRIKDNPGLRVSKRQGWGVGVMELQLVRRAIVRWGRVVGRPRGSVRMGVGPTV